MKRSHLQLVLATFALAGSGLAAAQSTPLNASYDVARDEIYENGAN
jgi:ABC-type sulfate transport system substrate-binding protein